MQSIARHPFRVVLDAVGGAGDVIGTNSGGGIPHPPVDDLDRAGSLIRAPERLDDDEPRPGQCIVQPREIVDNLRLDLDRLQVAR